MPTALHPHSRIGEGAALGVDLEGANELPKLAERLGAAGQRRLVRRSAGRHELLVAVVDATLCTVHP